MPRSPPSACTTRTSFEPDAAHPASPAQRIDTEFGAQPLGPFGLGIFQANAGAVGDFDHRIERGNRRAGIDERGIAERGPCRRPGLPQRRRVIAQRGFDKAQQNVAVGHAARARRTVEDRRQRVIIAAGLAALTEQRRMAGGSIEALIDGRSTGRDQLDLGMGYGAVLAREIANLVVVQVEHRLA